MLLERESELERIGTSLQSARAGSGSLIAIEGEPGIGKTRLLAEAHRMAALEMRLLAARGFELERELPFGIVLQLLQPAIRALPEAERERLPGAGGGHARPLLTGADPTRTPDELAVYNALYWVVADLSASGPLLLSVDDLHWADLPSLRFLAFLAPRVEELAIAAMLTVRTGEPAAASDAVRAISSTPGALLLRPGPLSAAACTQIARHRLGKRVTDGLGQACQRSVNGNPFLLTELLGELEHQELSTTAQTARTLGALGPESVSRAVLIRLARLEAGAVELARAIAVLGDGSALRHAARLAELDRDRATAVADALAGAAIIAPGGRLQFVHPIIRQAIYSDLPPFRRAALHLAAASMLRAEDAGLDQVAAHLLRADPTAEAWVVETLRQAGRQALTRGAPDAAVTYLERALSEPPAPELRPRAVYELGLAAARAGRPRAAEILREAFDQTADPSVRARAGLALCELLAFTNRGPEAGALVDAALAAGREEPKLLPRLYGILMWISQQSPPSRAAAEGPIRELVAAMAGTDEPPAPLLAYFAEERAIIDGTADEAAALAGRALGGRGLSGALAVDAPPLYMAVGALIVADRLADAERVLSDAVGKAKELGTVPGLILALGWHAFALYRRGLLLEAEDDAGACRELARARGLAEITSPLAAGTLILALLGRGRTQEAAALAGEADQGADPGLLHLQLLRQALAAVHLERRAPREALGLLDAIARWERELGAATGRWAAWRPLAALAHLALDERDNAVRLATEELELARTFGAPVALGIASRVSGLVEGGEGGLELLAAAAATHERSEARLEHARSLVELGAALRRANRRADARKPLRRGLDLAVRCGARLLAERATEELRATGARPRHLLLSGIESLTPSERRAATLAAQGLSNREIAQALFVTQKTVETHLGHAYAKLDTSRAGLADALGPHVTSP